MIAPLTHPVICRAGPSLLAVKGKNSLGEKTVVTLTSRSPVLKDGKARDVPHAGFYGYNLR